MTMFDVEALLAPISADAPSGLLLDYDAAFLELRKAATGKPEQRMGASVIPAAPPEWRKVESGAAALFSRTKDLRVAVLLAKARLHTAGLAGFFDGLGLVRSLLERYWDSVHPQLDPADGNDPAMRVNALAELADGETVLTPFRNAELASARGVGRICVRDLEPAPRREKPEGEAAGGAAQEKPPPVEAVFAACDREALARSAAGAQGAVDALRAMEALVADRTGGERIADLPRLVGLVELVARTLGARIARDAPAQVQEGDAVTTGPSQPGGGGGPLAGINSRQDVLLALDQICAYFEREEPSSPIPLLLRRAKRLVSMSFVDIIRDLVPDAAAHVEALRGKEE
jgi:type VI secretion system protein ImpA